QRVTWHSGLPAKMLEQRNVYFVNATHGVFSCEPESVRGTAELLEHGNTRLFSKVRPELPNAELKSSSPAEIYIDLSASGVKHTMLGITPPQVESKSEAPVLVQVSNGDLRFSTYPVLAGHFMNDEILYAEKAIDYNMKGALTERYLLGLYPGEVGT